MPVVPLIMHLIAAKWHVAHRKVKEIVRVVGALKAVYRNICLLVKLPRNAPGQVVQFHAVQLCRRQFLRQ